MQKIIKEHKKNYIIDEKRDLIIFDKSKEHKKKDTRWIKSQLN